MKINMTLAAAAIAASSSASALIAIETERKTICVSTSESNDGVLYGGSCDESENNIALEREILANGCAEGQVSLTATRFSEDQPFSIEIRPCLPPNIVQL